MENVIDNALPGSSSRKTRFSMAPPSKHRKSRRSLMNARLLGSSTSDASSDGEWAAIQNNIAETEKLCEELDEEMGFLMPNIESSKRMSLGTIAAKRQEIEKARRSLELDDELEYLSNYIDAMEANFKRMFINITKERLAIENPDKFIDADCALDALDLHSHPYIEWPDIIEQAIVSRMK